MSQYPPSVPPLGYAQAYVPRPDPRPTSVKVIAILAIIFGGWMVFGGLCSILQNMGMQLTPNPVADAMNEDKLVRIVTIVSLIVGTILGGIELASGIGALKLKAWARSGFIWYAIVNIATTLVGVVVNILVLNPRMQPLVQKAIQSNAQLNTPFMQWVMRIAVYIGYVSAVLVLIWSMLVLRYMNRPDVKAAFARSYQAMR
jgi:hypothetical protein